MLEIFMESVVGGEVGRLGVGLKEGGGMRDGCVKLEPS